MALYEIRLKEVGNQKNQTIALIQQLNGCGTVFAKCIVDSTPSSVISGLNRKDAQQVCSLMKFLGNDVEMVRDIHARMETQISSIQKLCDVAEIPYDTFEKQKNLKTVPEENTGEGQRISAAVVKLAVITVAAILFAAGIVSSLKKASEYGKQHNPWQFLTAYKGGGSSGKPATGNIDAASESVQPGTVAEEIVNYVFEKDISKVTQKELDLVISISCNDYMELCPVLEYELSDGRSGRFVCQSDKISSMDLICFRNLEKLDSQYLKISDKGLCRLTKLHTLKCDFDGRDSLDICCIPHNIVNLDIRFRGSSKVDYSRFTALEKLTLRCHSYTVLDGLDQLPALKSLKLLEAERIDDFNFLYDFTGLEELYIQSPHLKNIAFIKKMPELKSFGLEDTKVLNIQDLEPLKEQLTELHLIKNYKIEDYSLVEEMPALTVLSLMPKAGDAGVPYPMPDLSRAAGLTSLAIGRYNDCDGLEKLKNLESLTLYYIYDNKLTGLRELTNLKELHCHRYSVQPESLQNMAACKQLETVCFDWSYVWEDLSYILNLPDLKNLNLYHCSSGLIPERLLEGSGLEFVNLESARFEKMSDEGKWLYMSDDTWSLQELAPLIKYYPAVRGISLQNREMESVDALAGWEKLEYVNLDGNYISDLTPLSGLPIKRMNCYNNPIHEYAGMEELIHQ